MTGFNPLTLGGAMNDPSPTARSDNLAALNSAMAGHVAIEFPEGVLHLPANAKVVPNGHSFAGQGSRATSIQGDGDVFLVNDAGGNTGFSMRGFALRNDGGTLGTLLQIQRSTPLEHCYFDDMVWGQSLLHVYQFGKIESTPGSGIYNVQGGMMVGWKFDRCIFEFATIRSRFFPCVSAYSERECETKFCGKGLQLGDNGGSVLKANIGGVFEGLAGEAITICAENANIEGVAIDVYFENNTGLDLYRIAKTAHAIRGVSLNNSVFGSPAGGAPSKAARCGTSPAAGSTVQALIVNSAYSIHLPIGV